MLIINKITNIENWNHIINKASQLNQLLIKLNHPTHKETAQEAMKELDAIMRHGVSYKYRVEDYGVILNRDALSLIDKVSASIYQVYLDQEIPKTDKYFVVNTADGNLLDSNWSKCSFRRLELDDVKLQILIQRLCL